MGAPKYDIIQTDYQNPHASESLKLNVVVVSNTPEEKLIENIRASSEKYPDWLSVKPPHDGIAVLIGGGWSINDCRHEIFELVERGATVICMNNSVKWARKRGIEPHWQVIVDAKKETAEFVDPDCKQYFASQCDPETLERATDLTLIHFGLETIEEYLPPERVKKGGYVLLGAGSSVGNAALSVAFSQGYRELHLFGYDSSYNEDRSHGYDQPMNQSMPTTEVTWAGRKFKASVAMKGQAEKFPINALALKNAGCDLHVYGDGLLQTIYSTPYSEMSEREKYQLMWSVNAYRSYSPGEQLAETYLSTYKPDGPIIDFGCGTGRAGVKFDEAGHDVLLVDFTDNCRDEEALKLTFIRSDLTEPMPIYAVNGYCTDVMEHIATDDVSKVIKNIMNSASNVFFQISTVPDQFGVLIDSPLHLTVKPHAWWKDQFKDYTVVSDTDNGDTSHFFIQRKL